VIIAFHVKMADGKPRLIIASCVHPAPAMTPPINRHYRKPFGRSGCSTLLVTASLQPIRLVR
jgi:hypothetical protein